MAFFTSSAPRRDALMVLLFATALTAGCGRDDDAVAGAGEACSISVNCEAGLVCVAGTCQTAPTGSDDMGGTDQGGGGTTDQGGMADQGGGTGRCGAQRTECGTRCCNAGFSCLENSTCSCETGTLCDGACCGEGQTCELGQCVDPCNGARCGASLEQCCEGSEVCLFGSCTEPGNRCRFNEDCAEGEICEGLLGQCIADPGVACEYRPPVGVFTPEVECEWFPDGLEVEPTHGDVVASPIVMDLVDEGEPEGEEVPEVAFVSFDRRSQGCCNAPGEIRIISGACEQGEARTIATLADVPINNDVAIAAGDLDGDGKPEIVAVMNKSTQRNDGTFRYFPEGMVAFTRANDSGTEWRVLWQNEEYPINGQHTSGGPTISLADLNKDGSPEVIVGSVVLDGQDGSLKWDGTAMTPNLRNGQGINVFGPVSSVLDVDRDSRMEVFAGSTLYRHDGTIRWQFEYDSTASECAHPGSGNNPKVCDGYNGVVDFDGDETPELVSVRLGQIWVIDNKGELMWKADVPKDDCARNESGPPTIADFDGDGRPEIGTAGADFYVVADLDCDVDDWEAQGCYARKILWATPNFDCSSRSTASSVFDFEGDGAAEVVYADEQTFRIFSGATGEILFESDDHESNTRIEQPVIADVDNDNNAEVIVASAWVNRLDEMYGPRGKSGLRIWADAQDNWVRTRRVWNQHSYHVTNIDEDGTIPAEEPDNWRIAGLNNYRQNVQPSGLFDAPDFVVREVRTSDARCGTEGVLEIYALIGNDGALGIPRGVEVKIEAVQGEQRLEVYTTRTEQRLLPGQTLTITTEWTTPLEFGSAPYNLEVSIDGDMLHNECREDNNTGSSEPVTCNLEG